MTDRPCPICGQPILDPHPRRKTCGDEACQEKWNRLKVQRWRDERIERNKGTLTCNICGKEVPRKRSTQLTCGDEECKKENKRRIEREARRSMQKGLRKYKYRRKGVVVVERQDTPKRFCPRCRKPSHTYEYCDHCRPIVAGMSQNYTEESLEAGW